MSSRPLVPAAPAVLFALAAVAPLATSRAQGAPDAVPAVVITGNPFARDRIAAPVSVLSGDALVQRRAATLGETLDGLPGVSSTSFGPNASRPLIRGLGGDRVRVLGNAGASVDASALSDDHAVPLEPLVLNRVEVLRGPGALLYGSSAVGGVVNAIDNRIPREPVRELGGAAELRLGGAADERAAVALVEAGDGRFALHADAFGRRTANLRVPEYTPVEDGQPLAPATEVRNSASRASGGALGGAWFFGSGRVGLAADTYRNRYGVVAEPDVTIDMRRDHLGLAADGRWAGAPVTALRVSGNLTDYEHQEIEGDGSIGTTFSSRGGDLRLEAEHAPFGAVRGVFGLQLEDVDFSALGEEAFVPDTRTRKLGLFVLEELAWAGGVLQAGARLERADVDSAGDADPQQPKFGPPVQRRFTLLSASASNLLPLAGGWSLAAALSATERAPTSFELFANGAHAATGAYERGDTSLDAERGINLDLALQWRSDGASLRLGAFASRFDRFILLDATGVEVDEDGNVVAPGTPDSLPLYQFTPVEARFAGLEIEGRATLGRWGGFTFDGDAVFDLTRGDNRTRGEPLPRIAPWRLRGGLDAGFGAWSARLEVDHAASQDRVPANDTPTASYTLVHLGLRYALDVGPAGAVLFARLQNLGDQLAYNASSLQTIRGLAPLPGRAFSAGLRMAF